MDLHRNSKIIRTTLDRYTFRVATPEDVDGLVALWPEHWAEANYHKRGIVPAEDRYIKWFDKVMTFGAHVVIVAELEDEIVGFFAYSLDHNFSVDPVAVMGTFFVRKAHRRSAVAAILLELGLSAAKADGACAFHAPITSETSGSRALENMFKHQDFEVIGTMMGRAL